MPLKNRLRKTQKEPGLFSQNASIFHGRFTCSIHLFHGTFTGLGVQSVFFVVPRLSGNPLEIAYLFEKKDDLFHDSSKLHSCTLTNAVYISDLYLLTCSPLTVGIIKFNPEMHRHLFIMNVNVNILFHSPKSKIISGYCPSLPTSSSHSLWGCGRNPF